MGAQALHHQRDEILADLQVARRMPETLRVEPPEELARQLQPLEAIPRRLDCGHSRFCRVHRVPSCSRGEAPIPIMDSTLRSAAVNIPRGSREKDGAIERGSPAPPPAHALAH